MVLQPYHIGTILQRSIKLFQAKISALMRFPFSETHSPYDALDKFDHVVVLMLENRSFDNLLGYLYTKDELQNNFPQGQQYAGLHFDGPHCNSIPADVKDGHGGKSICVSPAKSYFQPYPDPGECYGHINTQLFGVFNPLTNNGQPDDKIAAPYNLPANGGPKPFLMNGFVKDYISVLRALKKKGCITSIFNFLGLNPKWFKLNDRIEDYQAIMECFEPEKVPVIATLAKEFAVFDHWHCDVPSQTYTNRAFWHSGTAYGFVNNSPMKNWIENRNGPTLFNLLEEKGISWNIYTDNPVSLTGIIHFQQLFDYHETRFHSYKKFLVDTAAGNLPKYSFVEPRFFSPHNDQHPSGFDSAVIDSPGNVGSVLLGEKLIKDVYDAIKNSGSAEGNNWKNTLLIITHDEHGGCYDHVAPGYAPTPDIHGPAGQQGFKFDRLGIRVPMIMISAYIKPGTIINSPKRHTSFLHTMSKKWGLHHLTERDRLAPDFAEVFNTDTPRPPEDWPEVQCPPIPPEHATFDFSNSLLNDLEKSILCGVSHWKTGSTAAAEKLQTARHAMKFLHQFKDLPGADFDELTHQWDLT